MQEAAGYTLPVAMIYCFNLMMGWGQLALPKAFVEGGWVLGLVAITVLAFMSYSTVTFIIEAHSVHNALQRHASKKEKEQQEGDVLIVKEKLPDGKIDEIKDENCKNNTTDAEKAHPPHLYEITMKTELGQLCNTFLNKFGYIIFYISFCLYLYGSSSIYATAVSKSLASIVCNDQVSFHARNDSVPCRTIPQLTLMQAYRISLAIFAVLCCPFAFCKLTSTKILQLSTMAFRCFALSAMVILALQRIGDGHKVSHPQRADFTKLPEFISTAICTFMCQFSVPSVVAPIRNKKNIRIAVFLDFCLVLLFCVCLSMTAVFAFDAQDVQDIYTLTFKQPIDMRYVLQMFPILTLGANYPVLAVVLRDNIKKFFLTKNEDEYGFFLRNLLFPLVAVGPSIVVSCFTYDVGMLVGYTGVYVGAILQYVIPVLLVYNARKRARETFGEYENRYASPLSGTFWLVLVLVWYLVSLIFVTYSKINTA